MLITCYSVKGGQGTSVTAAALALELCKTRATVLYDFGGGDLAPILGLLRISYDGIEEVIQHLELINNGSFSPDSTTDHRVVDAGLNPTNQDLLNADHRLLVTRGCYLALRRAVASDIQPTGIILISEPQRSLGIRDVQDVLGVPVIGTIPFNPAISRTVDAGLLAMRMPPSMQTPIKNIAYHLTSVSV